MNAWTLRCTAAASAAAFCLLSRPALASPPEATIAVDAPVDAPLDAPPPVLPAEPTPVDASTFAPAPAPPEAAPAPASGEALRIVEGPALAPTPDPSLAVPAPLVVPDQPPPACASPMPRVISKRPSVGTGFLVAGASGLALASVMLVLATLGRNEAGLTSKQALPIGLTALPLSIIGVTSLVGGIKANQKFTRWESENGLRAPASGNGMLVAGVVLSAAGAISMGFAIDHAHRVTNPDLGDRVLTGMAATTMAGGVMLLGGGVIQRSRFAAWEGVGYVRPGFYAGRSGGGLMLSGRF